ncbi:MAG: nicotinamide-nucleotide amidohydrolase family protein [Elusimicrobiales bacterium]|nr:nicotinamide-nucleotide amidohydrolase family protein [Elusimicrobiales bacterium]
MSNAFFIAVGNKLINFKLNTYPPIFSEKLKELGIKLNGEITIPDNIKMIIKALRFASDQASIVIICGGLGPTFDDLTKIAISRYLKTPLIISKKVKNYLKTKKNEKIPEEVIINQSYTLKDAKIFENPNGTAVGQLIKKNKKTYILLPGPKDEWETMWEEIKKHLKTKNKIYSAKLMFADIREVELENLIKPLIKKYNKVEYNILAGPNICQFNITSTEKDILKKLICDIKNLADENFYSEKGETLEELIGKILINKKLTLSTAESCTGGLLSSKITDIPGSSRYYIGGINAYSNEIKIDIIGVNKKTIEKYGAVSKETAIEMAEKIKKKFKTDCSISITGIAGPSGGNKKKPVGTVYICVIYNNKIDVIKRLFLNRDRIFIKTASANTALWILYKMIK